MNTPSLPSEASPIAEPSACCEAPGLDWQAWAEAQWQYRQATLPVELPAQRSGRLLRTVGLTIEAVGLKAPLGSACDIVTTQGQRIQAEIVGFSGEKLYLMPLDRPEGLAAGDKVYAWGKGRTAPVGIGLLGRILSGYGEPWDEKGALEVESYRPLHAPPINPLQRTSIHSVLDVGVRSINALLTVGKGQRIGLFAGSGVGKSVLLGMMAHYTDADVVVVALIGERGREVKEFIEKILGPSGLQRAVVVAAPADSPALMRLHGAMLATTIAEYYRDQGLSVLLLVDSLTRFAQAQREIALASGEPPATKGYPPSVFAKLPALVERAGTAQKGSITGFYTVLSEGDDQQDPIADAARAILDGHIVLSRELADSGHYPAIDIRLSISRVMPDIVSDGHTAAAMAIKQIYSIYEQNKDLVMVGAYQKGQDPQLDKALQHHGKIQEFLQQKMNERSTFSASYQQLSDLVASFT